MQINRREFNVGALAAYIAAFADMPRVFASATASFAAKALNRLTFGANASSIAEFEQLGLEAWLDRELAKPVSDDDIQKRLGAAALRIEYEADKDDQGHAWKARNELIPYQYQDADSQKLLPLLDYEKNGISYEERIRPAREVQASSLIRAVHADAQVREVLTQFWHDHFSVNSMRDEHTAAYFGQYDKFMREHALGNFRELLGKVARSPSMLYYLNNEASRASPANENYARELFELHTLGAVNYLNDKTTNWAEVPGAKDGLAQGYIDQDVYEAARALTGWSFGDGRYLSEGENAPQTGEFLYIDGWHDPYQKRILGVEFRANSAPMADGEKLFDILATHPATAKYIVTKLCRRLVSDEPPESLVNAATKVWLDNSGKPDQIAHVVRAIALSEEFAAEEPRKLKRPFEFLASFFRAVDAEVASPSLEFHWQLSKMGWLQHEFRPPTGHPDRSENWAQTNVLSGMVNLALNGLEDWTEAGKANLGEALPENAKTVSEAANFWLQKLHGGNANPDMSNAAMAALEIDPAATLPEDPNEREHLLRGIVAAAALTPQFLFR